LWVSPSRVASLAPRQCGAGTGGAEVPQSHRFWTLASRVHLGHSPSSHECLTVAPSAWCIAPPADLGAASGANQDRATRLERVGVRQRLPADRQVPRADGQPREHAGKPPAHPRRMPISVAPTRDGARTRGRAPSASTGAAAATATIAPAGAPRVAQAASSSSERRRENPPRLARCSSHRATRSTWSSAPCGHAAQLTRLPSLEASVRADSNDQSMEAAVPESSGLTHRRQVGEHTRLDALGEPHFRK